MKVSHAAEALRGQVMSLYDKLMSEPLDDADQTCLLRLVFEMDRLGDRCEELAGSQKAVG